MAQVKTLSPASPLRSGSGPRYQTIAGQLSASIRAGEYGPDGLLPTLTELSNRFGVSQITVRHAVRLLVEQRLVATVPGKGTIVLSHPPAADTRGREKRAGLIAPYFMEWSGLHIELPRVCHELGLDIVVRPVATGRDFSVEPAAALQELEFLRETCGQGLIIFGDRFLTQAFLDTRRDGEAAICLEDFNGLPDGIPVVTTDNFGGMFALTRHIQSRGHRRIGYYLQLRDEKPDDRRRSYGTTHQQRHAGYVDAMEAMGVPETLIEPSICREDLHHEPGTGPLMERLRGPDALTAIVCDNCQSAYALWDWLLRAGLRVPQDISLAAFDNIAPPSGDPRLAGLTVMDPNFPEVARQAVQLLRAEKRRLRDGRLAAPRLLLPPVMIERSTVCPPKG